jgi:RecG-like helicase
MHLTDPISSIPKTHSTTIKRFKKIGIETVGDLVQYFPVYYMQESWVKNGQPLGVGEKGIYTYTSNEYSTQGWFQFIKNGKLAVVTVGAKTKFTDAQLKAFAQMIADAF